MIRVAIVDDEPLVRTGLEVILDSASDVSVAFCCGGADAVEAVRRHELQVLLLDIRMPDVDGLAVLRRLAGLPSAPAVAMLTTFDATEYIDEALRTGAAGFLMKNTAPEQLVQAVRVLAAGGRVLAPEAAGPVIGGYLQATRPRAATRRVEHLTTREREVLALIGEGCTNRDIARRLHLSPSTVKDHVSSLLSKLGGLNRVQAAVLADRAHLVADSAQTFGAPRL